MKRNHEINTFRPNYGMKKPKLVGGDSKVTGRYEALQEQRRSLPIFPARRKLIQELMHAQSAVVIGETGSGKTTQIPQYIYEAGLHRNHVIACTQPRRVAAITVAQRVSEERGRSVGELIGYTVRFEDVTTSETKIKYMTDGMLLREAILDPLLRRYSVILLDEAHERTIQTDVLFGVIKSAQKRRRKTPMPLKIVVMSATMDVDHFSEYFNKAPVLYLEGRQYPVKVMYIQEPPSDYVHTTLVTIFQIHQEMPPNEDLLVFMTGQEEIESVVKSVRDISKILPSGSPRVIVYPLYAALPPVQQLRVFQKTPPNARKIIVSTNIAETSVTIQGIKYVIDTGLVKAKNFNAGTGVDILKTQQISKAQAWQRTGRAGRECPGISYRLYSEAQYEGMQENTVPEIQRCNMSSVTLQLLAMGVPDITTFDFMDKPSDKSIQAALTQLELLGAVEIKDDQPQLTNLGRQMAAFPLDPQLSKAIIVAGQENCLDEVLTIVSLLSVDSIVVTPHNKREAALDARKKFISPEGDHITLLNIYRGYKGVNGNKEWCLENFVHVSNMRTVMDIRKQLKDICVAQNLTFQSCGRDFTIVRKSLASGLFMNSAELQKEGDYVTLSTRKIVSIHPSSAIFRCRPGFVIFNELLQTSKSYMKSISIVDPEWLYDIAPNYFRRKKPGKLLGIKQEPGKLLGIKQEPGKLLGIKQEPSFN